MTLAVPPLPVLPSVPPLPALVAASSTLPPSFPLLVFDMFLGSVVFVPVPLPVVDIAESFMVGIGSLLSEHCLWRPVCERIVVSQMPRDLGTDLLFVWPPMLICRTLYLSAGLVNSLVLLSLLSTRMKLTRRLHSM